MPRASYSQFLNSVWQKGNGRRVDKDEDGVTMKQCEIAGRPAAFWMKKRRRKQPDLVARHFLFVSPVIRGWHRTGEHKAVPYYSNNFSRQLLPYPTTCLSSLTCLLIFFLFSHGIRGSLFYSLSPVRGENLQKQALLCESVCYAVIKLTIWSHIYLPFSLYATCFVFCFTFFLLSLYFSGWMFVLSVSLAHFHSFPRLLRR